MTNEELHGVFAGEGGMSEHGASPDGDRAFAASTSSHSVSPVPASIPSAARLAPSLTNDLAGELLREVCFADSYGAYSCFDPRSGAVEVSPFDLPLSIRTALVGCFANTPDEIGRAKAYRFPGADLTVAWHWDGDGTLAFMRGGFLIYNTDCKKGYGWERHGVGDWIDSYEHYEDQAQAIEARRAETKSGSVDESAVGNEIPTLLDTIEKQERRIAELESRP